jgi:hypothetical protein
MVNFRSQLQECTACQEDYLGDIILKNKKHILNGILLPIICNFFVSNIKPDSSKQLPENHHVLLLQLAQPIGILILLKCHEYWLTDVVYCIVLS